jgi:hypothetical protein
LEAKIMFESLWNRKAEIITFALVAIWIINPFSIFGTGLTWFGSGFILAFLYGALIGFFIK